MKKILSAIAVLTGAGLAWAGCSQNNTAVVVRSLERSGRAAFLCLANPQTSTVPSQGLQLEACPLPGGVLGATDYTIPHFISLVTQTARGEVAIVDVSANTVIDADKSIPGYNFLPVGAAPNDIVATPASAASFVTIGDPTRPAIFAIPTSKLPLWSDSKTPGFGDWPACALPPGGVPTELVIVPDMTASASDPGGRRAHCDGSPQTVPDSSHNLVGVDITAETQLFGRLKLAVALPELGEIDIIDAQDLLYREPGSFDPCVIERRVFLSGDANPPPPPPTDDAGSDVTSSDAEMSDAVTSVDGADVSVADGDASGDDASSTDASSTDASSTDASDGSADAGEDNLSCNKRRTPTPPASNKPHPYALALADDGRLFVSDDSASVIHVVDLSDPCSATEKPPLWAYSAADPSRPVISGAIAVSPLTKDGKRFVYASDVRNNGSLMVFDVSTTSTERTPLVRPDLKFNPYEPADRVIFSSPIESMTFVTHEVPLGKADENGVVPRGVLCDPANPLDVNRPPDDFVSAGAQPRRLRGVFGFLAMSNGELAVLDVDDYDAPCRRPRYTDDLVVGCKEDVGAIPTGLPSASQEASCNVVERHRPRSAAFFTNADQSGRRAPAMQNYPILYDRDGTALLTDQTGTGGTTLLPKLLGPLLDPVKEDKASWPLLATVMSTLATPYDGSLTWDPRTADANWVTFDLREPRVHSTQSWTVTYEGLLPWFVGRRGRLQCRDPNKSAIDCETGDNPSTLELFDSSVGFCDGGAQGEKMLPGGDIVEIVDDMPDPADPYWTTVVDRCSRQDCEEVFGNLDAPRVLDENGKSVGRDILIETSYQGKLSLKSSVATKYDSPISMRQVPVTCCFPYPVAYNIRASDQWIVAGVSTGFAHRVIPDPEAVKLNLPPDQQACIQSCDQNLELRNGRLKALTICGGGDKKPDCVIPCKEGESPPGCDPIPDYEHPAFQNAQLRFTLWDTEGSSCNPKPCSGHVRDRFFAFQESGGFAPMRFLLSSSSLVMPQSVRYVRGLDMLAIPDAVVMGLVLFDLNRLQPISYFY